MLPAGKIALSSDYAQHNSVEVLETIGVIR